MATKPTPGPPAAAGGEGRSGKKPPVFICWPGDLTGDIWHIAGAHIMADEDTTSKFEPIAVLGIFNDETHDTFKLGQDSFKYLRDIKVPCIVMKLAKPENQGKKALTPNHMRRIPPNEFKSRLAQLEAPAKDQPFDAIWKSDTAVAIPPQNSAAADEEAPDVATAGLDPVLHLWHSSTIMMKAFEKHLSFTTPEAFTKQYGELCPKLAGGTTTPPAVVQQAKNQFALLEKMFTEKPAVLFNHRIGKVNTQHNSNMALLEQVQKLSTAAGFSFIVIAAGVDKPTLAKLKTALKKGATPVFDLFMVETDAPRVDKRYVAQFWKLVAGAQTAKKVFGLIGGRSGSMDIASFMGVNCFSWDEMPAAFGIPSDLLAHPSVSKQVKQRIGDTSDATGVQFPQFMRLLNQFPIMDIGALDLTSFDRGGYTRVIPDFIEEWLTRAIIFPNIPNVPATIQKVTEEMVKSLEAPAWGITATNIRQLLDATAKGVSAKPISLAPGQEPLPPAGGRDPPPAARPQKGPGPAASAPATKPAPTAPVKNPTAPSGAGGAVSGRAEAAKRAP